MYLTAGGVGAGSVPRGVAPPPPHLPGRGGRLLPGLLLPLQAHRLGLHHRRRVRRTLQVHQPEQRIVVNCAKWVFFKRGAVPIVAAHRPELLSRFEDFVPRAVKAGIESREDEDASFKVRIRTIFGDCKTAINNPTYPQGGVQGGHLEQQLHVPRRRGQRQGHGGPLRGHAGRLRVEAGDSILMVTMNQPICQPLTK